MAFGPAYSYYVCAVNTNGQGSLSSPAATASLYGFSVGANAGVSPVTVSRNSVGAVSVQVTPSGGYTNPVGLAVSGLPGGVTSWFYPTKVTLVTVNSGVAGQPSQAAGGMVSSDLYFAVPPATPPGNYTLQITGTSLGGDGFSSSATMTLTVN